MDFIFMLTHKDRTVPDCLDVFDSIRDVGLRHVGFKDVGVPRSVLAELNRAIRASGATSYMEIVSTTPRGCADSVRLAEEIGVDRVLGGMDASAMVEGLGGSRVQLLPFAGKPTGHPTRLGGTPDDVAADCRRFERMGCAGVDLLAYRATESDPLDLIRAARPETSGYLVVAGSIDSPARVREVAAAGADAITVGSAVFDRTFSRGATLVGQLEDVLSACH